MSFIGDRCRDRITGRQRMYRSKISGLLLSARLLLIRGTMMLRSLSIPMLLFNLASPNSWGWRDAGHKLVASIAFRSLTSVEQKQVLTLLRHHPRLQKDFLEQMPTELDEEAQPEWLFQQAAIWP